MDQLDENHNTLPSVKNKSLLQIDAYKVNLDVFEGPLDLLLYLIKKEEVDIYEVSLEHITRQYLDYLDAFEVLNIEIAGEFLVMAATLLYIKSRTLLPQSQQMPEEDAEEDDPRWELIRQLIEYKKFKEAALHLRDQEEFQATIFSRPATSLENTLSLLPQEKLLLNEISIFDLIHAFQKALNRLPQEERIGEIYEETFTVADRIHYLRRALDHGVAMKFEEFFSSTSTRSELVVTFLAMLELIRMRYLSVRQETPCGSIWIEQRKESAPKIDQQDQFIDTHSE
ncbi:MAG: segregation/condensation protein A [Verrucomicrobiae bacterium]|jgi:segregation and condensation protein A|nr:segregation/condensation protein A [Verrucomicrobiae bacterium]